MDINSSVLDALNNIYDLLVLLTLLEVANLSRLIFRSMFNKLKGGYKE